MLDRIARFVDRRRWRLYYLALGSTLLLGVTVPKLLGPWDGLHDRFGVVLGADFLAFYTGGRMVLEGRSDELYDLDAQEELQRELLHTRSAGSSCFLNPPPYALAMAPLAALPYLPAVLVWWALSLLLLVASARLLARSLGARGSPLGSRAGLLFSLWFLPANLALIMGQNSFLTLALVTSAFVALRSGREWLAGLALGAMILKPQLALGFAVVLLVKGRWRSLLSASLTAGALAALCWVALPGAWESYLEAMPEITALVRNRAPSHRFPIYFHVSLSGALVLFFDGWSRLMTDVLTPVAVAAAALGIVVAWRRRPWEPGSPSWDLALLAAVGTGWMMSPHLLLYDVTLFLLPGWVAYATLGSDGTGRPFGGGRFYGLTVLTLLAASLWVPLVGAGLWNALAKNGKPLFVPQVVTVFLVWWLVELFRLARGPARVGNLSANEGPVAAPAAERS